MCAHTTCVHSRVCAFVHVPLLRLTTCHLFMLPSPSSLSLLLPLPPPPSPSHPLCPRLIAWSPSCGHSHAQSLISEGLTQLTVILCIIIFTAFLLDWFMLELSCTTALLVLCWLSVKECRLHYQPLQNILLLCSTKCTKHNYHFSCCCSHRKIHVTFRQEIYKLLLWFLRGLLLGVLLLVWC